MLLLGGDLNPLRLLYALIAVFIGIVIHEASHAVVATALGDDTPRRYGRLSLNPFRHFEPGMLLIFALFGLAMGATPVNPSRMRPNPKIGHMIVAAAGPLSNLLIAFVAALLLTQLRTVDFVGDLLVVMLVLNVFLFVLNLLPIPPLDGFTVILGVLPDHVGALARRYERYGMGILMLLFLLPYFTNIDVIGRLVGPIVRGITQTIT